MTPTSRGRAYHTIADKRAALAKRLRHRIAAREIARHPWLIGKAVEVLESYDLDNYQTAYNEWHELLTTTPADDVRRQIVAAFDQNMDRLRIDSPFFQLADHGLDFTDEAERRRINGIVRRLADITHDDVISPPAPGR
jgi:hypothetical protein